MPTDLLLVYKAYQIVTLPNSIAEKLKANQDTEWGKPWSWYVKYATLFYCDGDGVEHEIDSDEVDTDYKEDEGQEWFDPKCNDTDDDSDDDSENEEELPGVNSNGDEDPKDT
jgi:hypothetical protein